MPSKEDRRRYYRNAKAKKNIAALKRVRDSLIAKGITPKSFGGDMYAGPVKFSKLLVAWANSHGGAAKRCRTVKGKFKKCPPMKKKVKSAKKSALAKARPRDARGRFIKTVMKKAPAKKSRGPVMRDARGRFMAGRPARLKALNDPANITIGQKKKSAIGRLLEPQRVRKPRRPRKQRAARPPTATEVVAVEDSMDPMDPDSSMFDPVAASEALMDY